MTTQMGIGKLGLGRDVIFGKRKYRWTVAGLDERNQTVFSEMFVTMSERPRLDEKKRKVSTMTAYSFADESVNRGQTINDWADEPQQVTFSLLDHKEPMPALGRVKSLTLRLYDGCGVKMETWTLGGPRGDGDVTFAAYQMPDMWTLHFGYRHVEYQCHVAAWDDQIIKPIGQDLPCSTGALAAALEKLGEPEANDNLDSKGATIATAAESRGISMVASSGHKIEMLDLPTKVETPPIVIIDPPAPPVITIVPQLDKIEFEAPKWPEIKFDFNIPSEIKLNMPEMVYKGEPIEVKIKPKDNLPTVQTRIGENDCLITRTPKRCPETGAILWEETSEPMPSPYTYVNNDGCITTRTPIRDPFTGFLHWRESVTPADKPAVAAECVSLPKPIVCQEAPRHYPV